MEHRAGPGKDGQSMCSTDKWDFLSYRDAVLARMRAGRPFGEVEDAIELADVSSDQKAALWLLAFSMRDAAEQRRAATAYLAGVASG
jgi:hypothetical protein